MIKDHSDSERGNPLPPLELLFPIISNIFICTIPQIRYISIYLLYQSWSTDWNEKQLNGFTLRDRSDEPSHLKRTFYHGATSRSLGDVE